MYAKLRKNNVTALSGLLKYNQWLQEDEAFHNLLDSTYDVWEYHVSKLYEYLYIKIPNLKWVKPKEIVNERINSGLLMYYWLRYRNNKVKNDSEKRQFGALKYQKNQFVCSSFECGETHVRSNRHSDLSPPDFKCIKCGLNKCWRHFLNYFEEGIIKKCSECYFNFNQNKHTNNNFTIIVTNIGSFLESGTLFY